MSERSPEQTQLPLEGSEHAWPPADRFPHNFGTETVGIRIVHDLLASSSPLLVTGYGGLEHLLGFFHRYRVETETGRLSRVRLLVGVEPTLRRSTGTPEVGGAFSQEVKEYWLRRGVSLLNTRELLVTLDLLREGWLKVRTSGATRVHAKIYVGETAVTLGSSNFTRPGLERNLEGNARFQRSDEDTRYREAAALAEKLWDEGQDYTEGFTELLEQLLGKVTWQEALARACAELLEDEWAPRHLLEVEEKTRLWPSQRQGITQALWVLENHGAVLIADATGSGKTRMGAHLLRVLQDRNWRLGRSRLRYPMVVCPPAVKQLWSEELAEAAEAVKVFSHGMLSRRSSGRHDEVSTALRRTRILSVDEAHNFLNRGSRRSRMVYGNVADNVILFTATPINRGAQDLLSILELLGADNFEDEVVEVVERLGRRGRSRILSPAEVQRVRAALQEFVVRRTKADFNRLVDREPDEYLNALGERCRYPEHEPVVFPREDPPSDCYRAAAIREKAKSLRGIINLRSELRMPGFLRFEGWTEERFLSMRLSGAAALAAYHIRSRLRSSKVALVEHILGTEAASSKFGIQGAKSTKSGNVLATLEDIAGKPPSLALDAEAPDWLVDPEAHRRVAEQEMAIYEDILWQAQQMSEHRMDVNAEYLMELLDRHERLLAFDSHLISLHDLSRRLEKRGAAQVALATGEGGMGARRAFSRRFALGAEEKGVIGLCSDALAEGLNLQGASAVVHLDLPSVIRVLEQRIGRVDRMDSPHTAVEVHWPREPKAFRLGTDEKLFWRLGEVEDLLGSNVPLPDEFARYESEPDDELDVEEVIKAVERDEATDATITLADAFHRVRTLVEGKDALVPAGLYETIRGAQARVLSSVAVVSARGAPWVFLAVGASDRAVPRWVLIEEGGATPIESTLDRVASEIRTRLSPGPVDRDFDEAAAGVLASALQTADRQHRALLSRRKQRALGELEWVADRYAKQAEREGDWDRLAICRRILGLVEPGVSDPTVDLGLVADWWLQTIRPEWYEHLTRRGGPRPARLRQLRKSLKSEPIKTERLETISELQVWIEPLDRRVVAAIVGVEAGYDA